MASQPWLLDEIRRLDPAGWPLAQSADQPLVEPVTEYIVVDELEEGVAVLIVEPWPEIDQRGRLRFPRSDLRRDTEAEAQALERLLTDRRSVGELTEEQRAAFVVRPLRVGDVFCSVVDRATLDVAPDRLAGWLRAPVIDVTPEARDAAKAQYFAAVGPVLGAGQVEAIAERFFADQEPG